MGRRWLAILAIALATPSSGAEAFQIAVVENTGKAEDRHAELGFRLGLDYARQRASAAQGTTPEVTILDDQGDPALGARLLTDAFLDRRAELAVSLEAVPAAELARVASDRGRILLIGRGGAAASNRYTFETGHTESQLALACVTALGTPELNLFVVATDTTAGHAEVAALKDALERIPRGVFYAGAKFIPPDEADVGAAVSAEYDDLHYLHGAKTLLTLWDGGEPPITAIAATNPGQFGIRLALCGTMAPRMGTDLPAPAIEGVTPYFHTLPHNAANDWLIEHAPERPDQAMADGMTAAIAVAAALAVAPSPDTDALISSFEGLRVETPAGRMTIGPGDHRASHTMYQFRIEPPSSQPQLVREIEGP